MRSDIPKMVAKYVIDNNLRVPYKPQWARECLPQMQIRRASVTNSKQLRIMYGIIVPNDNDIDSAYERDRIEGNTLWHEAIEAERKAFRDHHTFGE